MGLRQMLQIYERWLSLGIAFGPSSVIVSITRANKCLVIQKSCQSTHPPGKKVYQRGAHIIWEVDGAKQKVFLFYSISISALF